MFFLSGAAGLIFEILWFRLAALSFGSSVWAATAVLAAFMAGLAMGNAIAAKACEHITRPLLLYAKLEIAVALSGLMLIFLLPVSGVWIAEPSRDLVTQGGGWPLQGLRFFVAFVLMLIPTTAMGMTLPLVVKSQQSENRSGTVIGRLYGWNTAGALSGILLAEGLLIAMLGVTGSALVACLACLIAAAIALGIKLPAAPGTKEKFNPDWMSALAAALSGAILLGLEVIWFRLLLLHLRGTDSAFAYLLALVLASIAFGSLLSSIWLQRHKSHKNLIIGIALLSALFVPIGYLALSLPINIWFRAALMIGPASLLSGALLPTIAALHTSGVQQASASTAWIWLANTAGATIGAALAGLYLLPQLGIQASLLLLGAGYLGICLCFKPAKAHLVAGLLIVTAYVVIPKDLSNQHLQAASSLYRQLDDSSVIAAYEGLNETVQLLERRKFGQPYSYRLITDGYSMSGTERDSQRYMKLFAWLPQSLHPSPQSALLISYGVGSTASALLADEQLKHLSIVDLSPDVLAISPLIHGKHNDPLADKRSNVIVEDGRQFLSINNRQFDLITAEPPPPRMKGVVNLYTREYFQLVHDRLNKGGYSSYWLPVDQLSIKSSHAIISAFCQVFTDCSLWAGSNYNWILLGSKVARPVTAPQLTRLWQTPQLNELAALGLEEPAMLGAGFLADAVQLSDWVGDSKPLTDNWPKRLGESPATPGDIQTYAAWADNLEAKRRFSYSEWAQTFFPLVYRSRALQYFDIQPVLNNEVPPDAIANLPLVHRILNTTTLKTPVFWLMGSDMAEQRLIDELLPNGYKPDFAYPLGIRALTENNLPAATSLFTEALQMGDSRALGAAVYSLCRQGEIDAAKQLALQGNVRLSFICWKED